MVNNLSTGVDLLNIPGRRPLNATLNNSIAIFVLNVGVAPVVKPFHGTFAPAQASRKPTKGNN